MHTPVRAFVAALVLTGAVVSGRNSSVAVNADVLRAAKTSVMPTPMCPLDDPNACGIANH